MSLWRLLLLLTVSFLLGYQICHILNLSKTYSRLDGGNDIETATTTKATATTKNLHDHQLSEHHHNDDHSVINKWCPNIPECSNGYKTNVTSSSSSCHPCQQRYLIVISSTRSASTTLTWMLDKLPFVHMGGENNDLLSRLHQLYSEVLDDKHFTNGSKKRGHDSWGHNPVDRTEFSCIAQSIVKNINPPSLLSSSSRDYDEEEEKQKEDNTEASPEGEDQNSSTTYDDDYDSEETMMKKNLIQGFKTVRFVGFAESNKMDLREVRRDLIEKVKFVQKHFPCSRYVVNYNSDIKQRGESMKKAFNGWGVPEDNLNQTISEYKMLYYDILNDDNANPNRQQAFLLDKAEWTKNITKLNDLVSWLGFSTECYFTELLEFNTKKNGYGHGKTELSTTNPKCRLL